MDRDIDIDMDIMGISHILQGAPVRHTGIAAPSADLVPWWLWGGSREGGITKKKISQFNVG